MKTLAIRSDFDFKFSGFRVLAPAQGFEHVKGYAGLAAGKPRGCSEHFD